MEVEGPDRPPVCTALHLRATRATASALGRCARVPRQGRSPTPTSLTAGQPSAGEDMATAVPDSRADFRDNANGLRQRLFAQGPCCLSKARHRQVSYARQMLLPSVGTSILHFGQHCPDRGARAPGPGQFARLTRRCSRPGSATRRTRDRHQARPALLPSGASRERKASLRAGGIPAGPPPDRLQARRQESAP